MLVCQIYVDDIFFGATNSSMCQGFCDLLKREFEMSMMGELTFLFGLQIKQLEQGIFIHQTKYTKDLLKKFKMDGSNEMPNPMSSTLKLEKDENGKSVDQWLYRGMNGSLLYLLLLNWISCLLLACVHIFNQIQKNLI